MYKLPAKIYPERCPGLFTGFKIVQNFINNMGTCRWVAMADIPVQDSSVPLQYPLTSLCEVFNFIIAVDKGHINGNSIQNCKQFFRSEATGWKLYPSTIGLNFIYMFFFCPFRQPISRWII